ncbi:MAG: cytochrome c, partial [Myxococcales bacterium]|nr:cytochrome c [Myxococcales bacterium]
YLKDTVPALDELAERMMLFERGEAALVVGLIEQRADLTSLADRPPFPRYRGFLAQYGAIQQLIRNGKPAAKKDPAGPTPPLQMPAWGGQLSAEDIDGLIAYLIRQYPWDDE